MSPVLAGGCFTTEPGGKPLSLSTDILSQIILHHGGCPVHHTTFSSTPGLYPLSAIGTLLQQLRQPTIPPDIAQCPLGAKSTPAENHCSKGYRGLRQRSVNASLGCWGKVSWRMSYWTGPWRIDKIPIGEDERIKRRKSRKGEHKSKTRKQCWKML